MHLLTPPTEANTSVSAPAESTRKSAGDSSVSPLEMSDDLFRRVGYEVIDRIANHLQTLPAKRVSPGCQPHELRALMDANAPLPQSGSDPEHLLHRAASILFDNSMHIGHPRFFGYITSGGTQIGVLADLLASAVNPNVGAWKLSPAASEIEAQTVRWLAEFAGFPSDGSGLLTSGGNMANFLAVYAARAARLPWNVREDGMRLAGQWKPVIYASEETHTWLQKAADLAGFGTAAIRWIPTDGGQRISVAALRDQIEKDRRAGCLPFMVIGCAGTTNTGAVDDLPALAALCRREDIWFHIDGAYGAFAQGVAGAPSALSAMGEADSLALDPHKWLYSPLDAGCVLVRKAQHLREAFSYHPPYYKFDDDAVNYLDMGMENSRSFRALKVWLALQQAGSDGYRSLIAKDIELARHLFAVLPRHACLERRTQSLSVVTFRYVPPALRATAHMEAARSYLNDLNRELLSRIEQSGEAFLSQAMVDGDLLLRACVLNYRTMREDVEAIPSIVTRIGKALHPLPSA
jgi:aromatic-L-amino-acid/L-tryptophan decarboxylase